ncbi:hypothetical protein J4G62_02325 [Aeromonas caviae]|uniref:hypothetical protein n=1 Tax=Aeromonas caviae TaxID=648 RepID=UPI001BD34957|nr:hypothetical protein [Aeromonas caviae]MBS4719093.1 hypothetical protein [Aeromonas caviae]
MTDPTQRFDDDLSGPSPGGDKAEPNAYLLEERRMYNEKRWMRVSVFLVAIGFACAFLFKGLMFAYVVGNGIVKNQASIIEVMLVSAKSVHEKQALASSAAKATVVNQPKTTVSVDNPFATTEHFNWLSTGSLLMLVGFLLATGLTLMLTLVTCVFKGKNDDSPSEGVFKDMTTPISKLCEEFYAFLKSKFSS